MNNLISNLPWDVKSTLDKVKNAVLNFTEMESKVREATNNDAWGAATTLLSELARGTNNYQQFNEIMPMIYKRFAESQKNWRQIYKTLQLVEYLLKNGAERVIDNIRDHIYEIKALQNFQFLDEKGKDQGINVRHRAKEICELVADTQRLRDERTKAQQNKNKYQGVAAEEVRSGGGPSFTSSSGGKYGGFGSDSVAPTSSGRRYSDDVSKDDSSNVATVAVTAAVASATIAKPQPNLLDFDFSEPAAAPAQQNGGFANFASAPAVYNNAQQFAAFPPPQQNSDFASFQTAPPIQQQSSFSNFASFQSAPVSQPTFNSTPQVAQFNQQSNAVNGTGWAAFTAAPIAPQTAFSSNLNQQTTLNVIATPISASSAPIVNKGDVWSSNLVSLDSLGKSPVQAKAPALNQLSNVNSPIVANGHGFSAFPAQQTQQGQGQFGAQQFGGQGQFGGQQQGQFGGQQQQFGGFSMQAQQRPPQQQQFGAFTSAGTQPPSQSNNNNDLLF